MIKKQELNVGDVFSLRLNEKEIAFGRTLAKVSIGHAVEIFDYFSNSRIDYTKAIKQNRLMYPQIIDSYSLFKLKDEGEWKIEKHENEIFVCKDASEIKYAYGDKSNLKTINILGEFEQQQEGERFPPYSPKGDIQIKKIIQFWRDKKVQDV
ncbi:hypothetical protein ULMS_16700 [Patiriisocius marinistellae]|uniref:Uncharacterized protein n=1 Tax=Patiriisocius marinistellae TaxID=2494560 RepID=A0A5J4FY76_9FLAO|nr:Imm26 family immunity protein [Patiriisocius marinistellae]GEQ86162.1 hypothetical protein ULMS_16700 [Patiriisocius marinistellae]